jgi:DNA-binding response OmpR family regulator
MLRSLAIELRGAPAPRASDPPLLDRKRILLVHPDAGILCWIADALEEEGAEVVAPKLNFDDVLACANRFALDGAVLNFISGRLPILRLANRLHARTIPIVFYTAFDTKLVARATSHMNCVIISNPGSNKAIVSALAALIKGRPRPRSRNFLDN